MGLFSESTMKSMYNALSGTWFGPVAVVVVNHGIWSPRVNCIASGWVATPMIQEALDDPAVSGPILAV
ncbi:hypothetical protein CY34DRAFT_803378 [Suillus luteus UH-Slu-Lm8-n1]|uniref:Unplaced genomic scaffold CY34scaffold_73, whole genome shotgun sequence n=1 Tax=Suillus luteus UH-Slu-Lm8-n1 TaxID=930992 RepID=A0A0D0BKI9_9AGAM|nr:hypothetical protein CY34DRAFT_803378 [Suillus luteus UH-Slu-Lm8-n1]